MAGIGNFSIGGASAPAIPFLLGARLFSLTATFDKNLALSARFGKDSDSAAMFDKTCVLPISVMTEE